MTVLTTGSINLPTQTLTPWLRNVAEGSTVATLSGAEPMLFGPGEYMTFDIGEAEYVGEGANKGASDPTTTVKTVAPYKFHKTVRWTQEVMWADEDHQLGVVQSILDLIAPALARALDYGVYHGINPNDGTQVAAMTEYLSQTTNSVASSGTATTDLDAAVAAVLASDHVPTGVGVDTGYAGSLVTARNADGAKLFPDFRPTTEASVLDGYTASTSRTVGARSVLGQITGEEVVDAFVGDYTGIRWGIQRAIGLELIEYGDPDGQGDLKRNNQVAFRSEVVYGWGIADLAAFAKIAHTVA